MSISPSRSVNVKSFESSKLKRQIVQRAGRPERHIKTGLAIPFSPPLSVYQNRVSERTGFTVVGELENSPMGKASSSRLIVRVASTEDVKVLTQYSIKGDLFTDFGHIYAHQWSFHFDFRDTMVCFNDRKMPTTPIREERRCTAGARNTQQHP